MARYAVNVEEADGRWLVYVPSLPGCLATGATRQLAEAAAPAAIRGYLAWRRERLAAARGIAVDVGQDPGDDATAVPDAGDGVAADPDADDGAAAEPDDRDRVAADPDPGYESPQIEVEEVAREWLLPDDPRFTVNAFFATDAPPLSAADVDELAQLLRWSRADLARAVAGLAADALAWDPGDGWSIERVVEHIGRAEWWYLDRIGLAPSEDMAPSDSLARLNIAREQLFAVLPSLAGVAGVVERQGELWSPRKVLRRALCHERDHMAQVAALKMQWAAAEGQA